MISEILVTTSVFQVPSVDYFVCFTGVELPASPYTGTPAWYRSLCRPPHPTVNVGSHSDLDLLNLSTGHVTACIYVHKDSSHLSCPGFICSFQ